LIGWYDLSWSGGTFPICFRPGGFFFCPKFQAPARWTLDGDTVDVDWGRYGKYEFAFLPDTRRLEGNAVPKNEADEANWRKAEFKSPLSGEELALIGDGFGTEWEFEWSGGTFPVQFKADGYNHFKCIDFPAHAHWSLHENKLRIHWGDYGEYELEVNNESKTMEGAAVGGDPTRDWRKGKFLRCLEDSKTVEKCDHHD